MKKVILILSLVFSATSTMNGQEISDNAIGLRLGSNDGFGAEISYQRKLKETNRLEVNLGLRDGFSDVKLTGLYQWVWNLENHFNWYAGAGGGIYDANSTSIFASGVVGIEYDLSGVSTEVILSKSSKYCQYKPPQAIPFPFLLMVTVAISFLISSAFQEVLKYPVPASIFRFSNFVGSIILSPTLTSSISVIETQSVPLNNNA